MEHTCRGQQSGQGRPCQTRRASRSKRAGSGATHDRGESYRALMGWHTQASHTEPSWDGTHSDTRSGRVIQSPRGMAHTVTHDRGESYRALMGWHTQ
eukprot:1181455-Prorocentrum_minimum.AAC.4